MAGRCRAERRGTGMNRVEGGARRRKVLREDGTIMTARLSRRRARARARDKQGDQDQERNRGKGKLVKISVKCRIFPPKMELLQQFPFERKAEREREKGEETDPSNFAGRDQVSEKTNEERSPARRSVRLESEESGGGGGGGGGRSNSGDRKCIVLDGGAARTYARADRARVCLIRVY